MRGFVLRILQPETGYAIFVFPTFYKGQVMEVFIEIGFVDALTFKDIHTLGQRSPLCEAVRRFCLQKVVQLLA